MVMHAVGAVVEAEVGHAAEQVGHGPVLQLRTLAIA